MKKLAITLFGMTVVAAHAAVPSIADDDSDSFLLPGTGKVAVVSFVESADPVVRRQLDEFTSVTMVETEFRRGEGDFRVERARELVTGTGAKAVVFVVEDKNLPVELLSMIDRWALVNCAALSSGVDKTTADRRLRRLVTRAAGSLIGVLVPRTTNGIMLGAASLSDIDAIKTEFLTFDLLANVNRFAAKSGIRPARRIGYQKACELGIAPPPSNAEQKAIWDKVHAIPKNPMKIEFDPKKGR